MRPMAKSGGSPARSPAVGSPASKASPSPKVLPKGKSPAMSAPLRSVGSPATKSPPAKSPASSSAAKSPAVRSPGTKSAPATKASSVAKAGLNPRLSLSQGSRASSAAGTPQLTPVSAASQGSGAQSRAFQSSGSRAQAPKLTKQALARGSTGFFSDESSDEEEIPTEPVAPLSLPTDISLTLPDSSGSPIALLAPAESADAVSHESPLPSGSQHSSDDDIAPMSPRDSNKAARFADGESVRMWVSSEEAGATSKVAPAALDMDGGTHGDSMDENSKQGVRFTDGVAVQETYDASREGSDPVPGTITGTNNITAADKRNSAESESLPDPVRGRLSTFQSEVSSGAYEDHGAAAPEGSLRRGQRASASSIGRSSMLFDDEDQPQALSTIPSEAGASERRLSAGSAADAAPDLAASRREVDELRRELERLHAEAEELRAATEAARLAEAKARGEVDVATKRATMAEGAQETAKDEVRRALRMVEEAKAETEEVRRCNLQSQESAIREAEEAMAEAERTKDAAIQDADEARADAKSARAEAKRLVREAEQRKEEAVRDAEAARAEAQLAKVAIAKSGGADLEGLSPERRRHHEVLSLLQVAVEAAEAETRRIEELACRRWSQISQKRFDEKVRHSVSSRSSVAVAS